MQIVNRKREKSLKEKENFEKYKLIQGENSIKTVSGIVEKMLKEEQMKDLIFEKRIKEEKARKNELLEKNSRFLDMKKKIKADDKDKLNDIKEKLQRVEMNLGSKKVFHRSIRDLFVNL